MTKSNLQTPKRMKKVLFKRMVDGFKVAPNGCWEWQKSSSNGYGRIYDGDSKRVVQAHRFFYSQYIGQPIPDNVLVLHKCDNPSCVNPHHLFLGTQVDNMQDMIAKGRHNRRMGESNHKAKLTPQQVLAIRAEYIPMVTTCAELGRKYGVTRESIHAIIVRATWKHL